MGPLREGAFGVGVVRGFAPGTVGGRDCLAYSVDAGVEGEFGECIGPVFDLFLVPGRGMDVPFPLGMFLSDLSVALNLVCFD